MEIKNRYDFVFIFDVKDGNPNGDPDAGNLPRIDAETGMGIVTDVCLKRKVRNYVQIAKKRASGYNLFIKERAVLNDLIEESYRDEMVIKQSKSEDKVEAARKVMCKKYFDVRTFGAVMNTGKNAGQVKGPVQLTFARSVEPIATSEHTITRMAVTQKNKNEMNQTMGRKSTIPYGLYVCHGFISANLAKHTGFSTDDLDLFWEALKNMFDTDRSAARGLMSAQKLIVFKHESELGNVPAHKLFDLIHIKKNNDKVARSFRDFSVTIDQVALPQNITCEELI